MSAHTSEVKARPCVPLYALFFAQTSISHKSPVWATKGG